MVCRSSQGRIAVCNVGTLYANPSPHLADTALHYVARVMHYFS